MGKLLRWRPAGIAIFALALALMPSVPARASSQVEPGAGTGVATSAVAPSTAVEPSTAVAPTSAAAPSAATAAVPAGKTAVAATASAATGIQPAGPYTGKLPHLGVHAYTEAFESWLGRPVDYVLAHWSKEDWEKWLGSSHHLLAPGQGMLAAVPLVVRGATLKAAAAGDYDGYYRQAAVTLAARYPQAVVVPGWEFNGSWFPWYAGTDAAAFRTAFTRLVTAFRAAPGQRFRFGWVASACWQPSGNGGGRPNPHASNAVEDYYPGDAVVDLIGLDWYDAGGGFAQNNPQGRWNWQMNHPWGPAAFARFAAARSKPMVFPEWGLQVRNFKRPDGGGDNLLFVEQATQFFKDNNTFLVAYFNQNYIDSDARLDTGQFPKAGARLRALWGR